MEWVVNATPRPLYLRETDPVPIVQAAWWAPGPVWRDEKITPRTEIRPARREFLYRLSYSGTSLPCKQLQEQNSTACSIRVYHILQTYEYEGLCVCLEHRDMKVPSATGIVHC
jgi:hypothetical protein